MPMANGTHPASPYVFISSTVNEFRDLRSAIAYTLRAQGFIVYLSEAADFDVRGDRPAIEECFENIRKCDYYILIVGNTRGNLYEEGISITRQEYRVARNAFLSTNRPHLFFYLREATEVALKGTKKVQSDAGISDPEHLASFIEEIQNPGIENVPSYLTRFRDFEILMNSLAGRMNLGRNLSEKLIRQSLLTELLSNLTLMVRRSGTSARLHHWHLRKVRENIQITPKNVIQDVLVTGEHVVSLLLSLVGRTKGGDLKTRCIEDALDRGIFLTFNPIKGALQESPLHKALQQTSKDIERLRALDTPTDRGKWDTNIFNCIERQGGGRAIPITINGFDLTSALAYYDLIENIFREHLALCQVLLGLSEELPPYQRQPLTPLGEHEEQKLYKEQVSAEEISKLIQNDIWPFGSRVPREIYGKTHDEQVKQITTQMYKTLKDIGIDTNQMKGIEGVIKKAAEDYLEQGTPLPEEGIRNFGAK